MVETAPPARVAIVGTAESWIQTPWNDTGLYITSLNDAYRRPGFVRADAWFDFHPLDHFYYPPDGSDHPVFAHQVPPGYYCRPKTHLEWLQKQMVPVYLHPDYQAQHPDAANWPHARAFPRAEIEAHYGRYFTSSPAWMMALYMMQGCRDFAIYGIHLATEHEYREQRPGFEFLIGRALGPSKVTVTVKDGMRSYVTQDGAIHLPVGSPILSSDFQYAFQPRPRAALEPLKWELHKAQIKHGRAVAQLKVAPWWQRTKPIQESLWHYEAVIHDLQEQMARLQTPKGSVIYG